MRKHNDDRRILAYTRYVRLLMQTGLRTIWNNRIARIVTIMYFIMATILWTAREQIFFREFDFEPFVVLHRALVTLIYWPSVIVFPLFLIVCIVVPKNAKSIIDSFQRVGFTNASGEPPLPLRRYQEKGKPYVTIYEFYTIGLPPIEWEEKQANIQSALNAYLVKAIQGDDLRRVLAYTVPASDGLPDILPWEDEYLNNENFIITFGRSLLGPVNVDLSIIPHMLVGGATGSGKTILFKLALWQCLRKQAIVILGDFKGGIDFSADIWNSGQCTLITKRKDFLRRLKDVMNTIDARTEMLKKEKCADIDEYNRKVGGCHSRLIVACDEVAVLLQRGKGMDKEEKAIVDEIEQLLITIGQIGRAYGVHLILSLQRPDANAIPGDLKCNLNIRVAGRCDKVLSQIILDNSDAAKIPEEKQGRFMLRDGTVFQAYYWRDN